MTDRYAVQKRIARKHLLRAKELRGTPEYHGALKRACSEMTRLRFLAARWDHIKD